MRLLFAGTPEVAVPTLDALLASPHEVVAVLTRADAPSGRGRRTTPSPVRRRAEELGLPVLTGRPRDPETVDALHELDLDCAAVVAYGQILRPEVLALPRHGWVNLHFSLLPAWRGAAPVQRAIMAGDEVTGATTFQIVPELDAGPVYGTLTETVRPHDTAGDLLGRLAGAGAPLMVATMDGVADGRLSPVPQPAEGISLAPKVGVTDARVRWADPALAVDRRVRGCTPAPGAWTTLSDGERLGVGPVRVRQDAERVPPGQVVVEKRRVLVGTGSQPVELGLVAPAGRRAMPAADWARGARLGPATVLGANHEPGDGTREAGA
ncbi:MAG: methionyl-tRNA formyltransferase [Cellulomonadaceae bacterium]